MSTQIPKYRSHPATGQARVTLGGKTFYLGKYGTPESRNRYMSLIRQWLDRTGPFADDDSVTSGPTSVSPDAVPTVNEVILGYLKHAKEYYQNSPKEIEKIKLSVRPLRTLFGRKAAATFDSLALEAVQKAMVESGLARSTVNERTRVLKRVFKWAVRKKLMPVTVYGELLTVEGLKLGRTTARETEPVQPVPGELVDAVLPLVSRHVRGMIQVQLLTGARPGEVCIMRRADIEMEGCGVWIYRPSRHKNQYRGHKREIYVGPKAQEILREFFQADRDAYLFSPRVALEERYQQMRKRRETKVQPSQVCRRKPDPKKLPGERYTTYSYRRAIRVACDRAGVPPWNPNRLRHNAGTNLRKEFGIELARILLGHKTAFTTEIYADADREKAMAVMARIG